MLRKSKILFLLFSIALSTADDKTLTNKDNHKNNEKSNITLPIPMIKKSFPSLGKAEYQGSPNFKVGVCLIGKNFSSMMIRIFCSLNKNPKNKYGIENCTKNNRYPTLQNIVEQYKVKGIDKLFEEYRMLMIVRNPIDRLISGFMQLCYFRYYLKPNQDYCYGCNKSLSCFINKLHNELWKVVRNEMVPIQFYDYHFYPQTWQCEYYKYKSNYTYVKYFTPNMEVFYQNIIKNLEIAQVPKFHLDYLNNIMHSIQTPHTTFTKNTTSVYKKSLYNTPTLLRKVCAMFFHDFIEFGFQFPKKCLDIKNSKGIIYNV